MGVMVLLLTVHIVAFAYMYTLIRHQDALVNDLNSMGESSSRGSEARTSDRESSDHGWAAHMAMHAGDA